MKFKLFMLCIIISIEFVGCNNIKNGNIEKKDDLMVTISPEPSLALTPTPTPTPMPTQIPTPAYDFSVFSGDWWCKDKHTELTIHVDPNGNVEGCITTVIGDAVPCYSIIGTIKDNVLISKLYDGDNGDYSDDVIVGSIKLYFSNPKMVKASVRLDDPDIVDIAVGDMSFKKE